MKLGLLPGYRDLFGEQQLHRSKLSENISSPDILFLLIAINNDLDVDTENDISNDMRIMGLVMANFNSQDVNTVAQAYQNYKNRNKDYQGNIFSRAHLLATIIKEINNYRVLPKSFSSRDSAFPIFLSYLKTIDQVEDDQLKKIDLAISQTESEVDAYKLVWESSLKKFVSAGRGDAAFESLRFLHLMKFFLDNHRAELIEYLRRLGFHSIGQLIKGFHQIIKPFYTKSETSFKHMRFIQPDPDADITMLEEQSINNIIGTSKIGLDDLRKRPLFKHPEYGYLVIDHDLFLAKVYKGPFFELYYKTQLRGKFSKFDSYASEISLNVGEKTLFRNLIRELPTSKTDIINFADGEDGYPDCYIRRKKDIFLIEFKGYLFPDTIIEDATFEKIKKYIDSRFIKNDKDSQKGLGQIVKQLEKLSQEVFFFEKQKPKVPHNLNFVIYPIIIHTDFAFCLNGINEYLNNEFQKQLVKKGISKFKVYPLTLIHLENIFDFIMRSGALGEFEVLLKRYFQKIKANCKNYQSDKGIDSRLNSWISFDELYNSIFLNDLKNNLELKKRPKKVFSQLAGITQAELDLRLW